MKKRSSIVVATLMAVVLSVLAVTKICRHFSGLEQAEGEIQNAQMPMEVLDALKLADSIGELTRGTTGSDLIATVNCHSSGSL